MPGKTASYKKSGKYYVITINDMPLENVVYKDEQTSKINTKTKYNGAEDWCHRHLLKDQRICICG